MSKRHTAEDTEVLSFRVPKPFAKKVKRAALNADVKPAHLVEEIFTEGFNERQKKNKKPVPA